MDKAGREFAEIKTASRRLIGQGISSTSRHQARAEGSLLLTVARAHCESYPNALLAVLVGVLVRWRCLIAVVIQTPSGSAASNTR